MWILESALNRARAASDFERRFLSLNESAVGLSDILVGFVSVFCWCFFIGATQSPCAAPFLLARIEHKVSPDVRLSTVEMVVMVVFVGCGKAARQRVAFLFTLADIHRRSESPILRCAGRIQEPVKS